MSTDAPTEESAVGPKPVEKEGCLVRMMPVTTPGCASCLTLLFLVVTVFAVWLVFFLDPIHVPWRHALGWPRMIAILALVAVIPWVVYRMIHWWTEGEPTPFPDLELAWYSGLQALATNGVSISSTPLYLVIGSASERQEHALMNASGQSWLVEGAPQGPSPLHWYANNQAIFLFCSDTSWTSALASLRYELEQEAASKGTRSPEVPAAAAWTSEGEATPLGGGPPAAPSAAPTAAPSDVPSSADASRGTLMLDQFLSQMNRPAAATPAAPSPAAAPSTPPAAFRGTLMLQADTDLTAAAPAPVPTPPPHRVMMPAAIETSGPAPLDAMPPVLVATQYSAVCLQQLRFLGEMLFRIREPVCPLNGILSLIQFETIYSTPAEIEELQKAINADLATIQYATRLRCPVTALIVGLERERGFQELVRRVGKERAMTQRFGRKFDVRAVPTGEDLSALSAHVCGAFEDWVYVLFREDAALARPGNLQLYELLSKVRCTWKTRLADILAVGYGCEMTEEAQRKSLLFSGCYAASTGDSPDRQAFVKGVFEKLSEEQELVEWTAEAMARQRLQQRLAGAGVACSAILLLGLFGMFSYSLLRWLRQ